MFVGLLHFHGGSLTHQCGCVAVKAGTRILSMWCTTPAARRALTIPASYLHHSFCYRKCVVDFNDAAVLLWRRFSVFLSNVFDLTGAIVTKLDVGFKFGYNELYTG